MHMSDALVSPAVFAVTGAASIALIGTAIRRVDRQSRPAPDADRIVPLMGVMGAFVFAAQMINFTVPATGSSGHIVGGILLSAVLGPWAAFLTLTSVLAIQCLLFADGGFMALGCNILNMAAMSCLVAYPLLFRPIIRGGASTGRILAASMAASVFALEAGALAVTVETEASGITALPFGRFLLFMLPIHLAIGVGEGLATAAVLGVLKRHRPDILDAGGAGARSHLGAIPAAIAAAALLVGGAATWIASTRPDGLEWSIDRTAGAEIEAADDLLHTASAGVQRTTAIMPDYDASAAGLVGCGATLLVIFGVSTLLRSRRTP